MSRSKKRFVFIHCLIMTAWLIIIFSCVNFTLAGYYGWMGLAGGIAAFVVSGISVSLSGLNKKDGKEMTEVNAVSYIITDGYLITALIANTLFCFLAYLSYPKVIPVTVNLILLICVVVLRCFTDRYRDRVARTAAHTAAKVHSVENIGAQLSEVISITVDEEEKIKLKKMKEEIDFSSNTSQPFTEEMEHEFRAQLDEIRNMIEKNADRVDVLQHIQAAEKTWKRRNGISSSIR